MTLNAFCPHVCGHCMDGIPDVATLSKNVSKNKKRCACWDGFHCEFPQITLDDEVGLHGIEEEKPEKPKLPQIRYVPF